MIPIFEFKNDEYGLGMCVYHNTVLVLTSTRIYRIDNADDDAMMTVTLLKMISAEDRESLGVLMENELKELHD